MTARVSWQNVFIALVIVLASAVAPLPSYADGPPVSFIGCPTGQAIRGINFVTRKIECVPVGNTAALEARIATLETALANAQATIACMHTVGDDVFFEGCNVHIRSGGGATNAAVNGLGNLIIGYNEDSTSPFPPAQRTGSHNLVVGPRHSFSAYGGVVAGRNNRITAPHATVTGGDANTASGFASSVSGGAENTASEESASVSGGFQNIARGRMSSVSGGWQNAATNQVSSVSGGQANLATGAGSSVSGGFNRAAPGTHDWAAGGLFEDF